MSFYFDLPKDIKKSKTVYDCKKCGLKAKSKFPPVEPHIPENYNGLVILGQNPSLIDMSEKKPFFDSRFGFIRSQLLKNGINVAKNAALLFASGCYQKKPSETAFKCHRSILEKQLKDLQPKLIICMGEYSFKYLFNLKEKHGIAKLRNRLIPNYEFNCMVFPIYDIYNSDMYKTDRETNKRTTDLDNYYAHTLKWDLERCSSLWKTTLNKRREVNNILKERKILEDITIKEITTMEEAKQVFSFINKQKEICLDYETTSLKPYDDSFEIVYLAFGNKDTAWVFHESFWKNKPVYNKWLKQQMVSVLENEAILKVIQNAKYEDLCSKFVYKIKDIKNVFCTMLATHVIDERTGTKSQDFQNLVRFGIPPYNETIKKYLKSESTKKMEDDEDFDYEEQDLSEKFSLTNKIKEAPKKDMIQYNGLDVITCFNNYLVLNKTLLDQYEQARDCFSFLQEGHWLFSRMSQRGIPIGKEEFLEFRNKIKTSLEDVEDRIKNLPEVIEYNDYLTRKEAKEKKGARDNELEELMINVKKKKLKVRGLTL